MSPVDRTAVIGFGRAAADYEHGRPGYPPAAIELLADQLGLWGGRGPIRVVDLFHWFDVEAAAAEITRVLVPDGGLGVTRNAWDQSVAWVGEVQSLIDARRPKPSRIDGWRERLEQTERFTALSERVIRHVAEIGRDALPARVSSISFIAMLPADERAQLLIEVTELLDRHGVADPGTTLATPYETHVVWARRRST